MTAAGDSAGGGMATTMSPATDAPLPGRIAVGVAALCAAIAIPMSFAFYVLPAILRQAGHGPEVVGLVWLVYLPFAVRVVWAPMVDRLGDGRPAAFRHVALAASTATVLLLLLLLMLDPSRDVGSAIAIMGLAITALATGFTALDGYILAALGDRGRQQAVVFQAVGFAAGGMIFGATALAGDGMSWTWIVAALAATTAAAGLPLYGLPPLPGQCVARPQEAASPLGLRRFLASRPARQRIRICILGHGGLGLIVGYLTVLQVDAGLTPGQVGLFGAVGGNICGLLAAALAGALLRWRGGWRCLGTICAAGTIVFILSAATHASLPVALFAVVLSTVAMILGFAYDVPYRSLVLMICGGSRGATQAAVLSSLDKIVAILAAALAGTVVMAIGLAGLFVIAALACLAATLLCVGAAAGANPPALNSSETRE